MVYFRCLDERHISGEIDLMKWNPKMDLIAISLMSGDIILHRLVSWQKVWHILSPKLKNSANDANTDTKLKVIDIEWRPDGKILAIAYDNNIDSQHINDGKASVALHDVETSEMIHKFTIDGKVRCICWREKRANNNNNTAEQHNHFQKSSFSDCSEGMSTTTPTTTSTGISPFIELLPKAKFFANSYLRVGNRKVTEDNINDLMKVESQQNLNVLAIGTNTGVIELYAFGVYKIAKIEIENRVPISYLALSSDLGMIEVLVNTSIGDNVAHYSLINYSLDVLKERSFQLLLISQIYAQSVSLLMYLKESMREISEAWEDVMVEIDSKLSNYVLHHRTQKGIAENKETKIPLMAEEFLELLACGNASDSLEKFLSDLTDKGLKKLGHSIELAYSNIQKLVVKNVQRVCQHLYCYFNTLKGMALWGAKFNDVGLDLRSVNQTLKAIASFLLKSTELQQVIDNSMRNVKAFIRWLYTSMIRLNNNEPTSQSDLTKVSQQDIQFVTEFIKENFEFESTNSSQRPSSSNFTLERVGQYLKDKNLSCIDSSINNMSINPWIQYLKERPNLTNTDDTILYLYGHNAESSFVQEHHSCDTHVRQTFLGPFEAITESFKKGLRSDLSNIISLPIDEVVKLDHTSTINLGYFYIAFLKHAKPANYLYIIRHSLDSRNKYSIDIVSTSFYGPVLTSNSPLLILDFKFYSDDIISLLLIEQESSLSYLVQLPLQILNNNFKKLPQNCNVFDDIQSFSINLADVSPELGLIYRSLDNMKSSHLAVSGSRKVACVSFLSKRRVRLFEMDVSEDDDDDQDVSDKMNDVVINNERKERIEMESNEMTAL